MHYIVLDLEWNIPGNRSQADPELLKIFPEEIIEIGAIKLEQDLRRSGRFSVNVRPRYYTKLNHFVEGVTKRQNGSLKNGPGFERAGADFLLWAEGEEEDNEYLLCTWSNSDSTPWLNNLEHYGLCHAQTPFFLDVQRLFAFASGELSTQRSIEFAAAGLGLDLSEPFHKAVNDASYTAAIFTRTVAKLQEQGELPTAPTALYQALRKLSYDPTIRYRAKADLGTISDPADADLLLCDYPWHCPACGALLQLSDGWKLRRNGLSRSAKAPCPTHGSVTIKVQIFRPEGAGGAGAGAAAGGGSGAGGVRVVAGASSSSSSTSSTYSTSRASSASRSSSTSPSSPWIVKADLHLQRPL